MIRRTFDGPLQPSGDSRGPMGQTVSIAELLEAHAREFVLLSSARFDGSGRVTHGQVVAASENPDVVYDELAGRENCVVVYLGPEGDSVDGAFLDAGDAFSVC